MLEPIGNILTKYFKDAGLDEQLRSVQVLQLWEDVVGPTVATHTRATTFRGKTLFVEVDSSVWMQQLSYLKPSCIEKLNHRIGSTMVENIFFRITDNNFEKNKKFSGK